jgi:hypothetical protein
MGEDSADHPDKPPGNVARLHPPRIPHHPTLDRAVQGMIGAQLRSMYEHYVDQPIPDRLLELVGRLGREGASTGDSGRGPSLGTGAESSLESSELFDARGRSLPEGER